MANKTFNSGTKYIFNNALSYPDNKCVTFDCFTERPANIIDVELINNINTEDHNAEFEIYASPVTVSIENEWTDMLSEENVHILSGLNEINYESFPYLVFRFTDNWHGEKTIIYNVDINGTLHRYSYCNAGDNIQNYESLAINEIIDLENNDKITITITTELEEKGQLVYWSDQSEYIEVYAVTLSSDDLDEEPKVLQPATSYSINLTKYHNLGFSGFVDLLANNLEIIFDLGEGQEVTKVIDLYGYGDVEIDVTVVDLAHYSDITLSEVQGITITFTEQSS